MSQRQIHRYGNTPARTVEGVELSVGVIRDQEAIEAAEQRLGWRVYATNQSGVDLNLEQAVFADRHEYIVERAFGRLKGKTLSLSPMHLKTDAHATALIRLLSIGLRVLALLEFVAELYLHSLGKCGKGSDGVF